MHRLHRNTVWLPPPAALLHWSTGPYVHELRYDSSRGAVRVKVTGLLGGERCAESPDTRWSRVRASPLGLYIGRQRAFRPYTAACCSAVLVLQQLLLGVRAHPFRWRMPQVG